MLSFFHVGNCRIIDLLLVWVLQLLKQQLVSIQVLVDFVVGFVLQHLQHVVNRHVLVVVIRVFVDDFVHGFALNHDCIHRVLEVFHVSHDFVYLKSQSNRHLARLHLHQRTNFVQGLHHVRVICVRSNCHSQSIHFL